MDYRTLSYEPYVLGRMFSWLPLVARTKYSQPKNAEDHKQERDTSKVRLGGVCYRGRRGGKRNIFTLQEGMELEDRRGR